MTRNVPLEDQLSEGGGGEVMDGIYVQWNPLNGQL